MNRVLREFWKHRCELDKAREKYLTAIERVKMFEGDVNTRIDNHYLKRLNQSVCKAMKKQYQEQTKEYQKFLRNISNFSFT